VVSAVYSELEREGLSHSAKIVVNTGQSKSPDHAAKLLTLGATAVYEREVHEFLYEVYQENKVNFEKEGVSFADLVHTYIDKVAIPQLAKMEGANCISNVRNYSGGKNVFLQYMTNRGGLMEKAFGDIPSQVQGLNELDIAYSQIRAHEDTQVRLVGYKHLNQEILNVIKDAGLHEIKEMLEKNKALYGLFSAHFEHFLDASYANEQHKQISKLTDGILLVLKQAGVFHEEAEENAANKRILENIRTAIESNKATLLIAVEHAQEAFSNLDYHIGGRLQADVNSRRKIMGKETVGYYTQMMQQNVAMRRDAELEASQEPYDFRGMECRRVSPAFINTPHDITPYRTFSGRITNLRLSSPFHLADFRVPVKPSPEKAISLEEMTFRQTDVLKTMLRTGQISAAAITVSIEDNITSPDGKITLPIGSLWRTLSSAYGGMGSSHASGEGGVITRDAGTPLGPAHIQNASGQFGNHPEHVMATAVRDRDHEWMAPGVIQIKVIQAAKPKRGGEQTKFKVSVDVAALRQTYPWVPLPSPAEFSDTMSVEDFMGLVKYYKSYGIKVDAKIAAAPGCEIATLAAAKAGVDMITLAGHGGTAASGILDARSNSDSVKNYIPLISNMMKHFGFGHIELWAEGNMIDHEDLKFVTAHGFKGISHGTFAMIATGCVMAEVCKERGVDEDRVWQAIDKFLNEGNEVGAVTPNVLIEYVSKVLGESYCPEGIANSGILLDAKRAHYMVQQYILDLAQAFVEDLAAAGCKSVEEWQARCNENYASRNPKEVLTAMGQKIYGTFDMSVFEEIMAARPTPPEYFEAIKHTPPDDTLGITGQVDARFSYINDNMPPHHAGKILSLRTPDNFSYVQKILGKAPGESTALHIGNKEEPVNVRPHHEALLVKTSARVAEQVWNGRKTAKMNAFPNRMELRREGGNPDGGIEPVVEVYTNGIPGQRAFAGMVPGICVKHTGMVLDTTTRNASGGELTLIPDRTFFDIFPEKIAEPIFFSQNPTPQTPVAVAGKSLAYGNNGASVFGDGSVGSDCCSAMHGGAVIVRSVKDFAGEFGTSGILGVLDEDAFGPGLGNGMRGGFIFVNSPDGKAFDRNADHSSIRKIDDTLKPLSQRIIKEYIEIFYEKTGSWKARELLDNWETVKDHFVMAVPRVLDKEITIDQIPPYRRKIIESLGKRITDIPPGELELISAVLSMREGLERMRQANNPQRSISA
ncbi:MAG: hypothetical protein KDD76_06950, partial [Rickettsiales bacterium]|nr:hypothetical protein [Rickettsiales bacterium]